MKENYLKNELYNLIKEDSSIFEFIQSGSLDGIWYWDLEKLENEWMSPKFWETLGYDPEEKKHLAGEWQDIIFQEDLKTAGENLDKHLKDPNHPYDQIVRYQHKSGSTVWIRCRGMAIRGKNGKPLRMLGAHTDITELKNAEKEISRLKEEYEKVFNGTQDAMFLIKVLEDGEFRFIRNNVAHQVKTKISLEQIMNKSPQDLLGKEMGDIVSKNYQNCVDNRRSIKYEEELSLPGGDRIWNTTLTPIFEEGRVSHIVGSSNDITERKKLEKELQKQANYDKLTELPNRRLFFERLERVVSESERDNNQFAILFLDLDGFKDINDNYGHEVGDEVLKVVGRRLSEIIRDSDTIARMGGDEFTMIIRNIENKKDLIYLVNRVHEKIKQVIQIGNIECNVNSSIGVSIYPENGKNSEELLNNADSSMYDIKKNGKGGIKFFQI
ncbi:MAG: diguanylate cyclase domain-containing protein [Thermotogota bacterium]